MSQSNAFVLQWPDLTTVVGDTLLEDYFAATEPRVRAAAALELAWVEMVKRDRLIPELVLADTSEWAMRWAQRFAIRDHLIAKWTAEARSWLNVA